jgi:menaquinone-specific isochorismate synthase
VYVEDVDTDAPLLSLLPSLPDDERFAFVQDGDGIIGWGVAARIDPGTGAQRFARAQAGLAALDVADAIAFASFTFDEDVAGSLLVVPETVLERRNGRTRRITVAPSGRGPGTGAVPPLATPGAAPDARGADRPRYAGSTLRDDRWLVAVAAALDLLDDTERAPRGALQKVVLARDLHVWSRAPFDTTRILHDLAQRFPTCFTFLVDHLLGASPERLLRRDGAHVSSQVLAGTARRGEDADTDRALGEALLASDKDRREHDLAARSVIDALAEVCASLTSSDAPSLLRLDNVQHLASDVHGVLDVPHHVLELLARVHPSAAVAGTPRDAALRTIRSLEGMDRGRYAGPVGWCTPAGDGEFAVALRCAEVRGERARLFAGAGIVAGSLPEAELQETWLKLQAMTGVLGA